MSAYFNFFSNTKELRFSYDICDEEKEFLRKRSDVLLKNLSKIGLGERTPKNKKEVKMIVSSDYSLATPSPSPSPSFLSKAFLCLGNV